MRTQNSSRLLGGFTPEFVSSVDVIMNRKNECNIEEFVGK